MWAVPCSFPEPLIPDHFAPSRRTVKVRTAHLRVVQFDEHRSFRQSVSLGDMRVCRLVQRLP